MTTLHRLLIIGFLIAFIFSIYFCSSASPAEKNKKNLIKLNVTWKTNTANIPEFPKKLIWGDIKRLGGGLEYVRLIHQPFSLSLSFDYIDNHEKKYKSTKTNNLIQFNQITYRFKKSVVSLIWSRKINKIGINMGIGFGVSKVNFNSNRYYDRSSNNNKIIDTIYEFNSYNTTAINEIKIDTKYLLPTNCFINFIYIEIDNTQQLYRLKSNIGGAHYELPLIFHIPPPSQLISGIYLKGGKGINF